MVILPTWLAKFEVKQFKMRNNSIMQENYPSIVIIQEHVNIDSRNLQMSVLRELRPNYRISISSWIKQGNISSRKSHENHEPQNNRPLSVLAYVSNIIQRIFDYQTGMYFKDLSWTLLSAFDKRYGCYHLLEYTHVTDGKHQTWSWCGWNVDLF